MASQYELQLKATLDTSDVQQKLNQLRQSQGQSAGSGSSGGMNTQRLNQTFTKIENTLNQLNKSIDKLSSSLSKGIGPAANNFQNRAAQQQVSQQQAAQAASMMIPLMSSTVVTQTMQQAMARTPWLKSAAYASYRKSMFNAMRSGGRWEQASIESSLNRLPSMGRIDWAHRMATSGIAARVLGSGFSPEAYQQLMNQYNLTQHQMLNLAKNNNASKTSINALLQNRKFASIIGGQLFGALGNAMQTNDYSSAGMAFNAVGSGFSGLGKGFTAGGSAAYTASLFGASPARAGRIGMGVGIVTASLSIVTSLMKLRDAALEAAEAQKKYVEQQYKNGLGLQDARKSFFDRILAKQVIETQNTDIAQKRLSYFKDLSKRYQQQLSEMEDPASYTRKVDERAEKYKKTKTTAHDYVWDITANMLKMAGATRGKTNDEIIDQTAKKLIGDYQQKFETKLKEAQAAEQSVELWQKIVDHLKELKNRAEDDLSRMRQEEGRRKSAVIDQAYEQADAFRLNDKLQQSQMFALSIMRDRKLAPQAQFDKLSAELDKVREERNKKLQEAYGLNKDILLGKGKNAIEYEEMQTKRNKALQEAEGLASRAGVLENALASIKNLTIPPDFSHMTSLAQYGFNMGEREDTSAVMEKYYSKMTDLTKQIRDKLDQGITTTATYE